MASDLPRFKYHPDPSAVFQRTNARCESCRQARGFEYIGPQYGLKELDHLCAYCIADGSAAEKFGLEFTDPGGTEPGPGAARLDELIHRTPGYDGPDGDVWPVHCDDFCAHLGRAASWGDIESHLLDLDADIVAFCDDLDIRRDEFRQEVNRESSPLLAHIFRCLTCGHHRLVSGYE